MCNLNERKTLHFLHTYLCKLSRVVMSVVKSHQVLNETLKKFNQLGIVRILFVSEVEPAKDDVM